MEGVGAWAARGAEACLSRGLSRSAAWLAELSDACGGGDDSPPLDEARPEERARLALAKSLLECREFARAAHASRDGRSPRLRFLHLYARYCAAEGGRLDDAIEPTCAVDATSARRLRALHDAMKDERLDGYALYLFGVVCRKLELTARARRALEDAVNATPWLWAAWLELATLTRDRDALESLRPRLPHHPIARFFLARAHLELKNVDEAIETLEALKADGYGRFAYLNAQIAVAHHDARDVDGAIANFELVRDADPYRLDELDVYSHLLYVKEARTELAELAHRAVEIDKYRVETCCIVGNYYSLRSEHQKAVLYFQRALKLNPNYLSAWILMGHEFIELQNTNAAIQSYRQAIEVNRNDYRAWNGLGQAYEILGLNGYCIYYYGRAAQQCPNDSRMLVALGEAYEKLNKIHNALKCYHRAHSVGDVEGMAILKCAKLYAKLSRRDCAAAAYSAACTEGDNDTEKGLQEAFPFLANYHLDNGNLDIAAYYANKCLEYEETKEEGKSLLKDISERRADVKDAGGTARATSVLDDASLRAQTSSNPLDASCTSPQFGSSRYRL